MREIKFRGKRIDNNEWAYGYLIIDEGTYYICTGVNDYIKRDDYEVYMIEVDPNTIGQYTGLKDKNGKEIYERDIVEYDTGARFIVVFEEMIIMCPKDKIELTSPGYFAILIGDKTKELCPLGNTQELCKVIGNITDNPELLEEGTKNC